MRHVQIATTPMAASSDDHQDPVQGTQAIKAAPPLQRAIYVVSQFPCLSETFIVREINALIEQGVDVRILSLKPTSGDLLPGGSAALLDRARHPQRLHRSVANVIRAVRRNPGAVARVISAIVGDSWRRPTVVLKCMVALFRGLEHVPWLLRFDPQFIHAHWATYPTTVAWALGEVLGRPFGFTCHAHDIFVERQLLARKIEEAALAVTISQFNVQWLSAYATPAAAGKLKVVHCGVDLDRAPWQPDGREPASILAVGRLDPIKGFATLVEAAALLKSRNVEFNCRLIGSGPLDGSLRRLADRLGVADRIHFAGAQPPDVVRDWMSTATLFALPSEVAADGNRDGIPVVLMEAMASGCPVISTRVSGIPELIEDQRHGVLVEERDPVALADAIQHLLADPDLRRRLAADARVRVEQAFDARKEATRLQGYMAEVAHGG